MHGMMLSLIPRLHDTTGCQTGLTTVLNEQPLFVIQPVVKPGCATGLTTGCIYDTTGYQTNNRFDNRLYRVSLYKHLTGCQTGLTTG